ncbi:hypothetical protein EXU85_30870 [Spirosoma sp. KCTC 42546]|uniref:hypothetical protein n=1 Tax=Spirosoma sp. KCTC 42546 TaxID=2520506 RepID=UPI001158C002|nr:hypothetical protein [Spirosoma sp. KCTC 42546]QDK82775.1 hypothetical protein EXU85_30870 [Spirosoma sp. KCTC 42546]
MKRSSFFTLLIMITAKTLLAQDGTWRIEQAQLPDGKSYNGSLTISRVGQSFGVNWATTAGNYSGLGLLADGKLFVGYGLNSGYGIVVYKTNTATQRIEGVWTASGLNGATGTETLTGRDGNYDLIGTNPDGRIYRGKLSLLKTGDTFQAQWQVANSVYSGVGFMSGDYLVIGYGLGQAFGTVEYVMTGNKARGRWAMGGGSQFGIENITR